MDARSADLSLAWAARPRNHLIRASSAESGSEISSVGINRAFSASILGTLFLGLAAQAILRSALRASAVARSKVRHVPKGRGDSSPARNAGFALIRKTRQSLRHIHECVLGILTLESEPVDPRL